MNTFWSYKRTPMKVPNFKLNHGGETGVCNTQTHLLAKYSQLAGAAEAVGSAEKRVETGERIHTSLSFVRRIIFRRIENDNLCTCAEGLISL